MIKFENVTKQYDDDGQGVRNITFHIRKGEFVFVIGPSGAGKSTLIKLILKETEPDSGMITVDGVDIVGLKRKEIPYYRRKCGIVFQDFKLLENKTVFENVAFALEITHHSREEINKIVPEALEITGIGNYADKYPNELSAGEQQRVAIARAVINHPLLLICDEPTGNLDPDTANEIMQLLDMINQTGTTVLMVTHAKEIVDSMNKRVIVMQDGKIAGDEIGSYDLNSAPTEQMAYREKTTENEDSFSRIVDFDWSGERQD